MGHFCPRYSRGKQGLHNLVTKFLVTGGPLGHINAETPGAIHEGRQAWLCFGCVFGAVMDKPDLVVTCVVGDEEADTGPGATA